MPITTAELENQIRSAKNEDEFNDAIANLPKTGFVEKYYELANKYGLDDGKVQIESGIANTTFHAFFTTNKKYKRKPQKYHIIRIGLAMGVTIEEMNELLKLAGHKELYAKNKDDGIIMFGMSRGYSIDKIEELLIKKGAVLSLFD